MNKHEIVVAQLVALNLIPKIGLFPVSEELINKFIRLYGMGNGNKFEINYARKLAGLNLLKENLNRGGKYTSCKEGLIYVISNPAWPNVYKIGMTTDLNKRLSSYQTYDPYRQYKVESYEFVLDRAKTEKQILRDYNSDLTVGEWVSKDCYRSIIYSIRKTFNIDFTGLEVISHSSSDIKNTGYKVRINEQPF